MVTASVGGIVFTALGCGNPATTAPGDIQNVILITVDTLRADFLGCYGHGMIKTPAVDRLAREGIRFTSAYSQSHITLPSHVSILTSLYPRDHGVVQNGRFRMDPAVVSIADVLRGAGLSTAAITSNRILAPGHLRGLGRGFESFARPSEPERNAAATNAVFLPWLERHQGKSFFVWVHYFDAHLPYQPPPKYRSLYYEGDPRDPRFTSMERVVFPRAWVDPKSWAHGLISWLDGITDFRYVVSQYAGEISFVDAMIGGVMAKLKALGLDEKTLVVFTADHGESLDEHGIFLGHLALYDPSTHVPLIFWAPARFRHPRTINALVMSVDIMPTILAVLGIEGPAGHMRGESLLPLIDGTERRGPHSYAFAEHDRDSQLMVRSRKWKYIKTLKPFRLARRLVPKGQRELYDLVNDPGETINLVASEPARVEKFEGILARWLAGAPERRAPAPRAGEPADYLKALGYVE